MKLSIFRKEIFLKEIKSVLAANEVMGEKRYSGEEGMVFKVDLKNTSSKKKILPPIMFIGVFHTML